MVTNSANKTTFDKTANTSVTLTANPSTGFDFVNWTGDIGTASATSKSITVSMNSNRSITANFVSNSTSPNLVPITAWEQNSDALGSSAVIDSSKKASGTISAVVTTVQDANDNSYSSLAGYLDTNLTGATMLHLTYTSDKAFWFSLDNNKDGFGKLISAGSNVSLDLELTAANFKKPSWSSSNLAFDLSVITGLIFDPVTDNDDLSTGDVSGTITITNLSIDGYIGNSTPIQLNRTMNIGKSAISMSSPRTLSLSIPRSGSYTVGIYSMNGRLRKEISSNFVAGIHTAELDGLSAGMYVVQMSGPVSITDRIMITR